MEAMELARRLAELGQSKEAGQAYTLALENAAPEEKMEAAIYLLQSGGDYRISYTCFQELYSQGHFREDCLSIMTQAFYEPNVKALKKRYEKNCRLLEKYPCIFRKDFVPFEDLPIRFYPYDDNGYLPFYVGEERFGDYLNFKNPVVSRNFFKDLDKPILADSVISQYELEYLHDNVRDSEYVGRDNHVYLHYPDWGKFCAYLQCWNLRPLLEKKKLVFLIGEELEQYPIDFKERFGVDYSQYPPQPVRIREINKLIWHTQLSAHNGGDFFNEVFDGHPNLLGASSIEFESMKEVVEKVKGYLNSAHNAAQACILLPEWSPQVVRELYLMGDRTDKDIFVSYFLGQQSYTAALDDCSRIAPALFFQPHFFNPQCTLETDGSGQMIQSSDTLEELHACRFLKEFKYIKTFTPIRRITNSYAATVRYMYRISKRMEKAKKKDPKRAKAVVSDVISERVLNRSYMVDPEDRLYRDSILVRFEDGKLNPKATFTALAAFLDLPYTESMTYCSDGERRDPHPETKGFDPVSVYRTYDGFANDAERYFLEYFMRDVYKNYGYDFQYYDTGIVDEEKAKELIAGFTTLNGYMRETWKKTIIHQTDIPLPEENLGQFQDWLLDEYIRKAEENRVKIAKSLLRGLRFVNRNGQPLRMMPMLKPDPAQLEQPLYH